MKFILTLILVIPGMLLAAEPQDIILKSRLDYHSSHSFMERLRAFLSNNGFKDPLNQTLESNIKMNFNDALNELPEDTQDWLAGVQSVMNLKILDSDYGMIIEDLSYSMSGFNTILQPQPSQGNKVNFEALTYAENLKISATKISFQVEIPRAVNGKSLKFDLALINPQFKISPQLPVDLSMDWKTALMPYYLHFGLHSIDLSRVFMMIAEKPEYIDFSIEDMIIPEVSVRVGNKTVSLDHAKVKNFFATRKEDFKKGIIDMIKTHMKDRLSNVIEGHPVEFGIPRTYAIKSKVNVIFDFQAIFAQKKDAIIQVNLDSHFCDNIAEIDNFCWDSKVPAKMRRTISDADLAESMSELDAQISSKANIAFSVSEHYLNQLIMASIKSGSLTLDDDKFKFGPESAFLLAEEKGENFSLYVDIVYKVSRAQRILIGKSELRFPVKFKIRLKTVDNEGVPHLQIKVAAVDTSYDMIVNGLKKYDLVSNVNSVRFQRKVVKEIQEQIAAFEGQTMVDLVLKEFKNTYLEDLDFYSDGHGRGTAVLELTH